jgi:hypothetical protein
LLRYADFESDAGTAIAFAWRIRREGFLWQRRRRLVWRMSYDRGGRAFHVEGQGEDEPVDLSIKPGDRIGRFTCRHRWGTHMAAGVPLWMRTRDLSISPDLVLDAFYEAFRAETQFPASKPRLVPRGRDAYGRLLADLEFQTRGGKSISYSKLMRMTFTKASMKFQSG